MQTSIPNMKHHVFIKWSRNGLTVDVILYEIPLKATSIVYINYIYSFDHIPALSHCNYALTSAVLN